VAPKLVTDDQLNDRLLALFRAGGFGVSLRELQEATGLKRSSLYHRFPGGKVDMATSIIREVADRFRSEVLAGNDDGPLEERVAAIGSRLAAFYDDGDLSCLIDTLSVGGVPPEVADRITGLVRAWIDAFAGLSIEAGISPADARVRAVDAVAAIEGALVVARSTGDTGAFRRAVHSLPDRLLAGAPSRP
jgi:AcrR family transcriptional regulator